MVQLSVLVSLILGSVLSVILLLLLPFFACFTLPLSHDYVLTLHPSSPHSPPAPPPLTEQHLQEFRDEGVTVLRDVLPSNLVQLLQRAVKDIVANKTLHCAMAAFNGPPILHRYSTLCQWPERAHDLFRDALLSSPLAGVASGLMEDRAVRVLNTIVMGSSRENIIPKRWHSDYGTFTGPGDCSNGLIMWLPVLEVSHPHSNGMMVATRSHLAHRQFIESGNWSRLEGSLAGQVELMRFWSELGETRPTLAPVLQVGDVLVMNKCTVHSASGVNSLARERQAWQIRFVTEGQSAEKGIRHQYPGMGSRWESESDMVGGAKYPLVWPATLPEEDAVRAQGHMVLTRYQWAVLMLSNWRHLLMTTSVRAADLMDLFKPEHPLVAYLAKLAHYLM